MIAVQIADFFLLKKKKEERAFDWCNLVIWLVGFVLYRILMHVDFALGNTLPDMVLTVLICLAESYGAKGIRVTETEEIAAAFEEAKKNTKRPTIIEFIIDPEEMVYPMIKPGGTLADMIMDC